MAVRRTREEKVKAQQRRTEMFSWENTSVKSRKPSKAKNTLPKEANKNVDQGTGNQVGTHYLRTDLLRTLLATIFVVGLLFLVYWLD